MTDLAWYVGLIVNGSIVIVLPCLAYLSAMRARWARTLTSVEVCVLGSVAGLVLISAATLILYLHQGMFQTDFGPSDTFCPVLMWIGYDVLLLSLSGILLTEARIRPPWNYAALVILVSTLTISATGMVDYVCYWNDGAIQVVYSGTARESLGLVVSIVIGLLLLYYSMTQRIEFLGGTDVDLSGAGDSKTAGLLSASVFFFLQFDVPRAIPTSLSNPVTVKIIGFLLLIGLTVTLLRYCDSHASEFDRRRIDSQRLSERISLGKILAVVFSAACLSVYLALVSLQLPADNLPTKLENGVPVLYLGVWRSVAIYADWIGCIVPLSISVVILALVISHSTHIRQTGAQLGFFLLVTAALCVALPIATSPHDLASPTSMDLIAFIAAPLFAWVLTPRVLSRGRNQNAVANADRQFLTNHDMLILSLLVFAAVGLSSFAVDILSSETMTGLLYFGGAGLADGLLWAPLLSGSLFAAFLVFLDVTHLVTYRFRWREQKEKTGP
jgi:hypothetical protein